MFQGLVLPGVLALLLARWLTCRISCRSYTPKIILYKPSRVPRVFVSLNLLSDFLIIVLLSPLNTRPLSSFYTLLPTIMRTFFALLALAAAPSMVFAWSESLRDSLTWAQLRGTQLICTYDYPNEPGVPESWSSSINLRDCIGNNNGVLIVRTTTAPGRRNELIFLL